MAVKVLFVCTWCNALHAAVCVYIVFAHPGVTESEKRKYISANLLYAQLNERQSEIDVN